MPCKIGDFKNILFKDKILIYNLFLVVDKRKKKCFLVSAS